MADLENSKWPPQKNLVFQLRQFSIFFHQFGCGVFKNFTTKLIVNYAHLIYRKVILATNRLFVEFLF